MSKAFSRSRRVAEQIQRVLSELIRRELRDPRLGSVTIVDVQLSQDLSHAKVFYSILGGDKHPELTQDIMAEGAKLLRGPLGRALALRHAPQLTFVADELIEYGTHLTTVISEAVKNDASRHQDDDSN
ncbi:MAG: 30S ribosome-binding factor RbfA [Steroidobacteraceae bacterium]